MSMMAPDLLKSYVRRIEAMDDEIKALNDDKSEIYKEARSNGFDVKVLRKVVSERRKDSNDRAEFDAVFDLYWRAVHGVVRAHVENIDEFDAETGEVTEPSQAHTEVGSEQAAASTPSGAAAETDMPETATQSLAIGPCEAVSERTALKVGPKGSAEAGIEGQPSLTPATTDRTVGANVSDVESVGVTAGRDPQPHSPETAERGAGPETAPASDGDAMPLVASSSIRSMSISPLEAREAGGLKGFGFTVSFEDNAAAPDKTVEASASAAPRLNPNCLKSQRGEPCNWSHGYASCSDCNNAAIAARGAA